MWRGLLAGAILSLLLIGAYHLLPLPLGTLTLAALIPLPCMLVGLVLGGWRKVPLKQVARWLDIRQDLQERLSTALEVSSESDTGMWRDLVVADAAGRAHLEAALHAGCATGSATPLAQLIALDVDFHRAIYRLSGNPAIEEMIAPQWPHMRRSMATVLAELNYRNLAWSEHETIAAHILSGNARAAEASALAHAQSAGRMTEERLQTPDKAA